MCVCQPVRMMENKHIMTERGRLSKYSIYIKQEQHGYRQRGGKMSALAQASQQPHGVGARVLVVAANRQLHKSEMCIVELKTHLKNFKLCFYVTM